MTPTHKLMDDALRRLDYTPIVGGKEHRREILQDFGISLIADMSRHNRNLRKMAMAEMVIICALLILLGWAYSYLPVWSRLGVQ